MTGHSFLRAVLGRRRARRVALRARGVGAALAAEVRVAPGPPLRAAAGHGQAARPGPVAEPLAARVQLHHGECGGVGERGRYHSHCPLHTLYIHTYIHTSSHNIFQLPNTVCDVFLCIGMRWMYVCMYVQVTSNHTYSLFFNRPEHGPFTGEIAVHDIGMYVCIYMYV